MMNLPQKVLILGSGGLRIGQAGEFDYSGSQAIKALKEEGIQTVLINPNIATIQTDPGLADTLYLEPLNVQTVEDIIKKEKPDGIFLSFGGQTALNLGLKLHHQGILKQHNVTILGTPIETIELSEDRKAFKEMLHTIDVHTAKSALATTVQEALDAAKHIGYPLMMRSGFSLGGLGSGIIKDEHTLRQKSQEALHATSQVLIEEYLGGWKEVEYEIVRDSYGNTMAVCNMENMDPMGVHTGESIVIAPSQTLTNYEYHALRQVAIKIADHVGIVGECNVQFALNPHTSEYRVIEMNARLSRSSALASKATGYPLAFIAAKLALGKPLYELQNAVTKQTSAFFEPALDYLVIKLPRWDTNKLESADRQIGSEMKSVGEVMAIGRSFKEALQKSVRMVNIGANGLSDYPHHIEHIEEEIKNPTDRRLFALYQYFLEGGSIERAHILSAIDPWFLSHIKDIADLEKHLAKNPLTPPLLKQAKQFGFADKTIATLQNTTEQAIRDKRIAERITPVVKQIDTLSGEFPAQTNYLYLTYHGTTHDIVPSNNPPMIIVGSGPYAIGSSVEFDWCAVNTAKTLKQIGETTIIINSNPETVSTDYDESDKLYFEELTKERLLDIADIENPKGIVISVGGQIANNLALPLHEAGHTILGTSPVDIDRAENRQIFSTLLNTLDIDQPAWREVTTLEDAEQFANTVGYPILVRPSYVLSGAAMHVIYSKDQLENYLSKAAIVSPDHPVVMSQFITGAKELEIDGVAQNGEIVIYAFSEHIENAGVHSGDATLVLPPQRLYLETMRRAKRIAKQIVKALNITGPFNMQYIARDNELKVIECNVRSSRSFPFVSKVTGYNFIDIATRVMTNTYTKQRYNTVDLDYVGVKSPQFSYSRLKGADPVAHVEMASTGEVACIAKNYVDAFFRSWLATEQAVTGNNMLLSIGGNGEKKQKLIPYIKELVQSDWNIFATPGTHAMLAQHNIPATLVHKSKQEPQNIYTYLNKKQFNIVINIPTNNKHTKADTHGYGLRRGAIDNHIPLITNQQIAQIFLRSLHEYPRKQQPILPWQTYIQNK